MRREATAQNVKAEVVFKNKFSLGDGFVVDASSRRDVLQACFSGKLTRKTLAAATLFELKIAFSVKLRSSKKENWSEVIKSTINNS